MVSLKTTSGKYHGRKAETYDEIRVKQARWTLEQNVIAKWLAELCPTHVLDCPVGTGRYIPVYRELKIGGVGIDISTEMLDLAKKKNRGQVLHLERGTAISTGYGDRAFDCVLCVRFLDLIDETAMRQVVTELARVSWRWIICTIRLGQEYLPKSNTAEHNEKEFWKLVDNLGFAMVKSERFREGSWNILLLERKQ